MGLTSYLLPILLGANTGLAVDCKPPPRRSRAWITNRDYPPQARKRRMEGDVRFTLEVSDKGCPVKCTVTASSGHSLLDETTCKLLLERARFEPDLDENGVAVSGTWSNVFRWRL